MPLPSMNRKYSKFSCRFVCALVLMSVSANIFAPLAQLRLMETAYAKDNKKKDAVVYIQPGSPELEAYDQAIQHFETTEDVAKTAPGGKAPKIMGIDPYNPQYVE